MKEKREKRRGEKVIRKWKKRGMEGKERGKGQEKEKREGKKGRKEESSNVLEPKLLEFNCVPGIFIHLSRVIKSVQPIKGDGLELDLPSYPQHN